MKASSNGSRHTGANSCNNTHCYKDYCKTNTYFSLNCSNLLTISSLSQDTRHATCQQEQHADQQNKETSSSQKTLRPSPGRRGRCSIHRPPLHQLQDHGILRPWYKPTTNRTRPPKTPTSWTSPKL